MDGSLCVCARWLQPVRFARPWIDNLSKKLALKRCIYYTALQNNNTFSNVLNWPYQGSWPFLQGRERQFLSSGLDLPSTRRMLAPMSHFVRRIVTYKPTGTERTAKFITAGFPCQAAAVCSLLVKASSFLIVLEGKFAQMLLQGLSGAGLQLGLDDPRSALVRQPFRVFDELEDPCRAQVVLTIWVGCCHDCLNQVLLRLGLLLENVLALLSKQEKTRKVWKYILKAWFTFFRYSSTQPSVKPDPGSFETRPASPMVHGVAEQCWVASPCLKHQSVCHACSVHFFTKAGRKRVFILCAVPSFRFPDWLCHTVGFLRVLSKCFSICEEALPNSKPAARLQKQPCNWTSMIAQQDGFNAELGVDMTQPWNKFNQVPIHEWLLPSHSEEDKCRLKCMGNIVVPSQARMASKILARMEPLIGWMAFLDVILAKKPKLILSDATLIFARSWNSNQIQVKANLALNSAQGARAWRKLQWVQGCNTIQKYSSVLLFMQKLVLPGNRFCFSNLLASACVTFTQRGACARISGLFMIYCRKRLMLEQVQLQCSRAILLRWGCRSVYSISRSF